MTRLREYDEVRIVRLNLPTRPFDGTDGAKRPPRIGDTGIVVYEHDAATQAKSYSVENVTSDGATVWLADFDQEELELVSRPRRP